MVTTPATITLLSPPNNSVTPPLQRWTLPKDQPKGSGDAIHWNDLQVVSEDRSFPEAISFEWEIPSFLGDSAHYELTISTTPDFEEPFIVHPCSQPNMQVSHLHIATRYFWKVTAKGSGRRMAVSPVWSFTTNSTPPRWISVPGITNVRDIGGWPLPKNRMVRQGIIYRGSEMNNHVDITNEGRDILINDLGIRTDLDLRKDTAAAPALDTQIVRWINIPAWPYAEIAEEIPRKNYCRMFEVFAEASNYPIFFHCWGGADRGGTLAFLLGALLGMSMENLIHDYELTSLSIWGVRHRKSDEFQGLLEILSRFGSTDDTINQQVEAYLCDAGLSQEHITRIRKQCIVPAPD